MERTYYIRESQRLAYTIKKHIQFEWVRYDMYSEMDIYREIPMLVFRFFSEDEKMYSIIKKGLDEYNGNVKWILYKGFYTTKNYVIEPYKSYVAREQNYKKEICISLRDTLQDYKDICKLAIQDIPNLCSYIDKYLMGIEMK